MEMGNPNWDVWKLRFFKHYWPHFHHLMHAETRTWTVSFHLACFQHLRLYCCTYYILFNMEQKCFPLWAKWRFLDMENKRLWPHSQQKLTAPYTWHLRQSFARVGEEGNTTLPNWNIFIDQRLIDHIPGHILLIRSLLNPGNASHQQFRYIDVYRFPPGRSYVHHTIITDDGRSKDNQCQTKMCLSSTGRMQGPFSFQKCRQLLRWKHACIIASDFVRTHPINWHSFTPLSQSFVNSGSHTYIQSGEVIRVLYYCYLIISLHATISLFFYFLYRIILIAS